MSKGIGDAPLAVRLADVPAVRASDALGYRDRYGAAARKPLLDVGEEFLAVERDLRQIYEVGAGAILGS